MIEETLAGICRSFIVGGAGIGLGYLAGPVLGSPSLRSNRRILLLVLCVLPVFAPPLLTAYAYARLSLPLVHYPWLKELAYIAVVSCRFAPLGALLFHFFPPALGASGRHCHHTLRQHGGVGVTGMIWRRSLADTPGVAFVVVFILAFQEFEIASLTGVNAWTVELFDAHAGGLPWQDSLRLAALPFLVQIALVAMLLCKMMSRWFGVGQMGQVVPAFKARRRYAAWGAAAVCAAVVTLVPVVLVSREAVVGFRQLWGSFALQKELVASTLFGLSGGIVAFVVATTVKNRWGWCVVAIGLCGPLLVALGAVRVFQSRLLHVIYDSPLPLIVALTILLLPLALFLEHLCRRGSAGVNSHVAKLSEALRPRWTIQGRRSLGSALLLCLLAYTELTASAILAPPGMTTAPVRLYNLMHYGQTEVLSAMTITTFMVPLVAACAIWGVMEGVVRLKCWSG